MEDSIFTQIIKGEIPCHKVYEDEHSLAFMDIHPIQPGQVLVVPKKQVPFVWDLEESDYQGLMAAVQKIGRRLRHVYPNAARIGLMIQGLDVANHAHVKVFPYTTPEEYYHQPDMSKEPNHEILAKQAADIQAANSD